MPAQVIQIPVGPMANFAYLVIDTATSMAAVVDPGWESGKILARAQELSATVTAVWLTHAHFDHIQEVAAVTAATGAPVRVHALEKGALGSDAGTIQELNDGDILQLGETAVTVLHTPGHSPGAVCFQVGGHIITGDTLFVGAIGRTDLPGSDPRAMGKSLKRLAQLPEHLIVCSGHDYGDQPLSTIGREKQTNPYMKL